jgi:hypothetical protein
MTFTIQTLANYLGCPASSMLADVPFKDWAFEKSQWDDLEEPMISYVFPHNGLDFQCDGDDKVRTIFLYSDQYRHLDGNLLDLSLSSNRLQVIERLGPPSKSGGRKNDPILGKYGPWDRFTKSGYTIHVEYRVDADRVRQITLMRPDVVP